MSQYGRTSTQYPSSSQGLLSAGPGSYGGSLASSYGVVSGTTYGTVSGATTSLGGNRITTSGGSTSSHGQKKQRIVEVMVEKPVVINKYVDVEEEIIIEKPVERRIENEYVIEKVIEVPKEVIIEKEVEVIREETKEIVVEKQVEYEKFVDVPIERYREVPVEVLKEVEVKVPKYVDRWQDRTIIKPIETVVQEHAIYVDKPVYVDRVVEVKKEVPIERIVDRYNDIRVNKEYFTEVEEIVRTDKIVEIPVERPYDVFVDKVYTREVDKVIKIDKIVDKPYDVVVEKVVTVPVEVIRENRVTIPVDKVVEIPVERIVEVPVKHEKHVELLFENIVDKPVYNTTAVDIPVPRIVEKPVKVETVIEEPVERVVERKVEVPFGRIIDRQVPKEVVVESQRINETTQNLDRTVDISVTVERYMEVPREEVVEKPVAVTKVIEKPVMIPRYVDRYVDKIVEVRVEKEIPKMVEVPRINYIDKKVDLNTRVQRANFRERAQSVPINTMVKRNVLSQNQKRRFQESSIQLANSLIDNEKLKSELVSLRERIQIKNQIAGLAVNTYNGTISGSQATAQENERLRRIVADLENSLRVKEQERSRLRAATSVTAEMDVKQTYDGQDIPRLQENIRRIRQENENLRRLAAKGSFSSQRRQIGTRVVKQDVRRESPKGGYAMTRSTSAGALRTSTTSTSTYLGPGGVTTTVTANQVPVSINRPSYITAGSVVNRPVGGLVTSTIGGVRTSAGYTTTATPPGVQFRSSAGYTPVTTTVPSSGVPLRTTGGSIYATLAGGPGRQSTTYGGVRTSQTLVPGTTTVTSGTPVTTTVNGARTSQFGGPMRTVTTGPLLASSTSYFSNSRSN